ncbi:hypothetical protein SAMN05216388_1008177 [Halorientalis persicus]|jgi:hypothetical protein|uniref:Uncharacterized protein n=1 Tax=Halorientalis persicus TaxID=1367881 RepID=A0A1H8MAF8_9EURY|nr:hypothetical protein SAMN05216388_1008177 [Halorientalis persicus]
MDWRILGAGSVVCVGFGLGWLRTDTLGGAVVGAGLVLGCLAVSLLIDSYADDL